MPVPEGGRTDRVRGRQRPILSVRYRYVNVVEAREKPADGPPAPFRESHILLSLSHLFHSLHKPVSVDALKAGMAQGPEGAVSPAQCLLAAERFGMKARLVSRKSLGDLSPMVLPAILFLEGGRTCVLTEMSGETAQVILAEEGEEREVSRLQLEGEYVGKVFLARMTGRLDNRTRSVKLLDPEKWFWGNLFRFVPIYRHVLLASLVINVLALATSLFVMNVYDRVIPNNATETLWVMAVGVMIAIFFDFLLKNLRSYFVDVAGKNADMLIASQLMQQVLGMRMEGKPASTGGLANNLREFESLREFFSSTTLLALLDLPFLFLFVCIIGLLAGPMALIPVVAIPVILMAGLLFQLPLQRAAEDGHRERMQKNAFLVEILNGIETVKSCNAEGRMQHRWEEIVGMNARSNAKSKFFANLSIHFSQFVGQTVSVSMIIAGVYRIGSGDMTTGALVACNILLGRALAPLGSLAAMMTRLQRSRMALKALDTLMEADTERKGEADLLRPESLSPCLDFRKAGFTYPGASLPALNRLDLSVKAGERVGVIGRVGSGKSTLARLAIGLYRAESGMIEFGGIDLRQLDPAEVRKRIGVVTQDNYLFYGNLKDNITMGHATAADGAVLRAAEISGVADFTRQNPAGYGLQAGERGMQLSGGQRQAVSIARALVHDPELLILDEPTSQMDSLTETLFKERLTGELDGKTLLLITHKMSMLSLVDRLVVLDSGTVLADGPKEEVLRALRENRIRPEGQKREVA